MGYDAEIFGIHYIHMCIYTPLVGARGDLYITNCQPILGHQFGLVSPSFHDDHPMGPVTKQPDERWLVFWQIWLTFGVVNIEIGR